MVRSLPLPCSDVSESAYVSIEGTAESQEVDVS